MIRPKDYRLYWDKEIGWILEVPTTLSQAQLDGAASWALKRQIDRYRSLPPGERKEQCKQAIEDLQAGKIQQRPCSLDGAVYASTERVNPGRTLFTP